MWLRLLVSNWIQQNAREKILEAVSELAQKSRASADANRAEPGGPTNSATTDADDAADAPVALPPCEVAILFALDIEAGGTLDLLPDKLTSRYETCVEHVGRFADRQVLVAETGVGAKAAAQAAADVIKFHKPAWLISAGFAGALQDNVRRGHVVMAETIVNSLGETLETGLKLDAQTLAQQPALHAGRLLTVDHVIRTEGEKRQLGQQHQAVACDMETWAIADVCRQQRVRFLSVRVITDAIDEQLPPEVENLMGQKSWAGKLGAAAGAIFHRPSSVKDMWNLREAAIKASDRLAKFLAGTVAQLK